MKRGRTMTTGIGIQGLFPFSCFCMNGGRLSKNEVINSLSADANSATYAEPQHRRLRRHLRQLRIRSQSTKAKLEHEQRYEQRYERRRERRHE